MPRIALLNILIGWSAIAIAAFGGVFIANDLSAGYIIKGQFSGAWEDVIRQSSHGHFNMFGMLHILFGLTLPYSKLPAYLKKIQTMLLAFGLVAMGPMMLIRSTIKPSLNLGLVEILIGVFMSLSLVSVLSHIYGICLKLRRVS